MQLKLTALVVTLSLLAVPVCSEEAAGSTDISAVQSPGLAGYNPVSEFYFPG